MALVQPAGNYMLMMFYTTVAGWMLIYFAKMASGTFTGLDAAGVEAVFGGMLARPGLMLAGMALVVLLCMGICSRGLQNGVERITKYMMLALLFLLFALAVRSVTLPGAGEGLAFYLKPDFSKLAEDASGPCSRREYIQRRR